MNIVTKLLRKSLKLEYCGAVIVAAGTASRMGGIDKVMAKLNGEPMICRTVRTFQNCDAIQEIVIVTRADLVPKMKKLLKFKIADGLADRTIVSGIAEHCAPEELVGKQVLFIANFAPRQFKNGLVSEGMILSAVDYDGSLAVTSLLREVKPGSQVG